MAARPSAAQRDRSDLLLVGLTFGTGAVDAISFLALGRVFTANMTGNIVILGLAAGSREGSEVVRAGASLVAFIVGVFVAARLTDRPRAGGSWSSGVRLALALEAVAQAAFLAGWLATSGRPGHAFEVVLVGFSATAMGLQTGAVAAVGVSGVSTTYVTGTLTGLITALATGKGSGKEWLRRTGVLVALLVGAACSALLVVDARRLAPVLPLVVTTLVLGAVVSVRSNG
jgi:uncharacterized membrane protein YoaK (UPF0700 family)